MPWLDQVGAVLMAWYPGEAGGTAIAEVFFGDVNPSGKLPVTFPRAESDLPPFDDTSPAVQYGYFHGYRYLDRNDTAPLFPFGFGLAYTTFRYSNLAITPATASPWGRVRVTADVTNTGPVAGDEVAQLYVGYRGSRVDRAVRDLKAFARVHLEPGETRTVPFEVRAPDLATGTRAQAHSSSSRSRTRSRSGRRRATCRWRALSRSRRRRPTALPRPRGVGLRTGPARPRLMPGRSLHIPDTAQSGLAQSRRAGRKPGRWRAAGLCARGSASRTALSKSSGLGPICTR